MLGHGFVINIIAASQKKREGVNPDRILYVLLVVIVGSRILFVLTNLGEFVVKSLDAFAPLEGEPCFLRKSARRSAGWDMVCEKG